MTPPFAVAIYGQYGSGKSFFMEQIRTNVERFAQADTPLVHHHIRQVHFSAWHYAGANLWASLLFHIFEELASDGTEVDDLLFAVLSEVEGAQQLSKDASAKLSAATAAAELAKQDLDKSTEQYEAAHKKLREVIGQDIWSALQDLELDEDQKATVDQAFVELGIKRSNESIQGLRSDLGNLIGLVSDTRRLSTLGGLRSPLVVGGGVGLAISAAVVVIAAIARPGGLLASITTTGVGEVVAAGAAFAAWTGKSSAVLKRILTPATALQTRIDQRLEQARVDFLVKQEQLQADLRIAERDRTLAQHEMTSAQHSLSEAKARQESLTGPRMLELYLDERMNSDDYSQHLGLIGQAHRDLKSLSSSMERALAEADAVDTVIDRIVLYIDDLDRCSVATVNQVLDAVHLLLALPLFAVVVGVDPDWLVQSLVDQRPALAPGRSQEHGGVAVGPTEFLEKIFHLTYTAPNLTADGVVSLITAQLAEDLTDEEQDAAGRADDAVEESDIDDGDLAAHARSVMKTPAPVYQDPVDIAKAVTLTISELEALDKIAPMLARTPRKVMRFYNILAVVRASADADPDLVERIEHGHGSAELLLAVALCVSLPQSARSELFQNSEVEGSLADWLAGLQEGSQDLGIVSRLLDQSSDLIDTPLSGLRVWMPHIAPWV